MCKTISSPTEIKQNINKQYDNGAVPDNYVISRKKAENCNKICHKKPKISKMIHTPLTTILYFIKLLKYWNYIKI